MSDDQRRESVGRAVLTASGVAGVVAAVGLAADIGQLLSLRTELLVAALSLLILAATITTLIRLEPLGRGLLAAGMAVVVLATGMFTIAFYRSRIEKPARAAAPAPQVVVALPPWERQGKPVQLTIPFGSGDKLPQGAFLLDPPRLGPDAYRGDVSIQCETAGKGDHEQNCTGKDPRTWIAAPIDQRSLVGAAAGDSLTDPAACEESKGVNYQAEYLELAAGRSYCLRKRGETFQLVALRIVSLSTAQPLPTNVVIETAVWTR